MSHDPEIRALKDHVINLIAAGEVVERPFSIVKELIENSLDAGASKIEVSILGGGIDQIRVRDNGSGVPADQMYLALQRHCTSKLSRAEQINTIASLGFRGEALASIASVAAVDLISRTESDEHAWQLSNFHGAYQGEPSPATHPVGTSVIVNELFARVPARRRFLKQARTESLQIQQLIKHIAFCYPNVAFNFDADERSIFRLIAGSTDENKMRRLKTLFGREFAQSARLIAISQPGLAITGWLGPTNYTRPRADLQYLAVNHRAVKDRALMHALKTAYAEKIEPGRYACFALHLQLPFEMVDVNVHPNKTEIRFREPRNVHDVVYSAVNQSLNAVYATAMPPTQANDAKFGAQMALTNTHGTDTNATDHTFRTEVSEPEISANTPQYRSGRRVAGTRSSTTKLSVSGFDGFVGIIAKRFVLLQDDELPAVVDLNRLLTALVLHRLKADRTSRPLIVPERVPVNTIGILNGLIAELNTFGVMIEPLGPEQLVLRQVPTVLPPLNYERFLIELAILNQSDHADILAHLAQATARSIMVPISLNAQSTWFAQIIKQLNQAEMDIQSFHARRTLKDWVDFLAD